MTYKKYSLLKKKILQINRDHRREYNNIIIFVFYEYKNNIRNIQKKMETSFKEELNEEQQITIKVVNAEGAEVYFKIKRKTKLQKLMDAYCKKQGVSTSSIRFHFDGKRIEADKCVDDYEMEDDDVIDAMAEQTGGCSILFGNNNYYPLY